MTTETINERKEKKQKQKPKPKRNTCMKRLRKKMVKIRVKNRK